MRRTRSGDARRSSPSAGATCLDRDAVVPRLRDPAGAAARREPRIRRVVLAGSVARGTATPASDADLVGVLTKAAARRMDRIPSLLLLFQESPLLLDLHPYTVAEWEGARRRGDALVRLVERGGIDLLAR